MLSPGQRGMCPGLAGQPGSGALALDWSQLIPTPGPEQPARRASRVPCRGPCLSTQLPGAAPSTSPGCLPLCTSHPCQRPGCSTEHAECGFAWPPVAHSLCAGRPSLPCFPRAHSSTCGRALAAGCAPERLSTLHLAHARQPLCPAVFHSPQSLAVLGSVPALHFPRAEPSGPAQPRS